jgi:carboxymethylenebutenolidase
MADLAVPFFFAQPVAGPPWPGVVVVMEGYGVSPQLLRVCQRLGREGYAALAPDLFWRFGGTDPDRGAEQFGALTADDARADLVESVARLRALGASSVGMTGFCRGGFHTYLAATTGVDLQAAAPFYGAGIAPRMGEPGCPLLLFFGGRDQYVSSADVEAVRERHPDQVVVYPDAGHGFMRDGSDSYDEAAATDAWARLLTFFGANLR